MYFARLANDAPEFSQRINLRTSARLHKNIAKNSCFDWAGNDLAVTGIGRELIKQTVARAAADDVNDLDAPGDYPLKAFENHLVL